MATIYDIASLAGTSIATVSYVLNGNGDKKRISKETQEKILAAAASMNYRPNTSARRLSTDAGKALNIALLWPNYNFETQILSTLRAVKTAAAASPDSMELSIQFYQPGTLAGKKELMSAHSYNAVIIAGAGQEDLDHLAELVPSVPIVIVNRILEGYTCVSIDQESAGQRAAELIAQKSTSSVSAFFDSHAHIAGSLRRTAFLKSCEELGISLENSLYYCDATEESAYEAGMRLVRKGKMTEVIFCNHEVIARGLLAALHEAGIRVGEDVHVLSTNVAPENFARFCSPSLSVIDLKMQAVMEEAFRLCMGLIFRRNISQEPVLIKPEIIFRDSFIL